MIDVLAEAIQKLSARRGLLARELATVCEALSALQRVRDEAPKHGTAAAAVAVSTSPATPKMPPPPPAPQGPRHCGAKTCGKVLPPQVPGLGRPRLYCKDSCARRAHGERKAGPAGPATTKPSSTRPAPADDDGEDPTDRALRRHRELHPVPESASGMRSRARGARS